MRLFGLEITKAAPLQQVYADRGRSWWPIGPVVREPFPGAWQRNYEGRVDSVLGYSAVYACVTLIAQDVGKLRCKLVEEDTNGIWSEVDSPAFSPVLRKPNRYQNRIKFFEQWIVSKLLHGNTYILVERDSRQVVVSMYVLDPTKTKVLVAPDGSVFYELRTDNLSGIEGNITVPASEIIHDTMVPLYHPLCGVSPLTACWMPAVQALAIQRNSTSFFENGSQPGGILTAPANIADEDAKRLKAYWEEKFTGNNAGKVAVVGSGLKYETMAINAVDAQLIEQLKMDAEEVCSCFHVPAYMIGVGAPPSYNNIQALNQQYYTQCLQGLIEAIELCLDEGLGLVDVSGHSYGSEFDIDSLLRMDTATQYKTISDGIGGGFLAPNEGRRKIDLPPVDGGDTPYLQQQNFSLSALNRRDKSNDPFALAPKRDQNTPSAAEQAAAEAAVNNSAAKTYALIDYGKRRFAELLAA